MSASNGDIPPADLETNMEKSDDGSPKKVKKRGKHSLIKDYLVDYTSNSNLHGLKYIGEKERTFVEKIFWIFMFTCCVVLCAGLIAKVYKKWNESPVIVSFAENPMPVFKIPYPAVTVCFETKAMQSKYNFTKYYHLYNGSETYGNLTDQERFDFEDVSLVCDSHLSPKRGRKFGRGIDTVNTLKEVCPNITETFFGCKWKDVNKDYCSDLFSPILTEEGICYTFNTLGADHLLRQEKLHTDYQYLDFAFGENLTTPWTLENGYPDDTPIETYPHRGSGYGAKAGLSFVLMATEVDLDYLCRGPVQGYKILLHNPAELPRLSQQYFRAPLSQEVVVAVKPKMMTTSEGLLPYSPETRQCYFPSERYLQYFKVYTQANCEMECLSNFTYIRCGCVHFGMLYGPNMTVCNAGSIECVQKAQMEMVTVAAQTSLNKDDTNGNEVNNTLRLARDVALRCKCKPSCTSIEYEAETSQADFDWRAIFTSYQWPIAPEMNDTYMTRIFIFFKEAQFITSRRSELYGQTDFLANCGGLLGLFMGFSFLSVVEIIYFLTLRLWCALWKKKSKKRVADENQTKVKPYID
ncbi:pickpocket protein 28-like isoform X2 [Choristoneura fumiferana]|uniref:pickpocket protein 28-like isoform X2 n=1 Tax=Choristoneura fumiferana TaxID=7141 RepID=UPI003D1568A0